MRQCIYSQVKYTAISLHYTMLEKMSEFFSGLRNNLHYCENFGVTFMFTKMLCAYYVVHKLLLHISENKLTGDTETTWKI